MAVASAESGTAAVELVVGGMHCDGCASLIEETLSEDPRVHQVAVDPVLEDVAGNSLTRAFDQELSREESAPLAPSTRLPFALGPNRAS